MEHRPKENEKSVRGFLPDGTPFDTGFSAEYWDSLTDKQRAACGQSFAEGQAAARA